MLKTLYRTPEQLHLVQYLGRDTVVNHKYSLDRNSWLLRRDTNRQTVQNIYGCYNDPNWREHLTPQELELRYGNVTWTGQFTVACGDFCMYRNPTDLDTPENAPICGVRIVETQIIEEIIYND